MRRHLAELWLIAIAVVPLVAGLDNELQEPDPAQYAEVARRIQASGDWLHFADSFGPFLNKPPVALWLVAAAVRVLGETSIAVRLPSLLAGLVLLVAVARIGQALWDRRTGLIAAALLGSSVAFQLMVADPKVDMLVTCMMGLSMWLLLEARRRPGALWLAWLAAGLGILSKGPIGLAAPAVAVLPEAIRRKWGSAPEEPRGSLRTRLFAFKPVRGLLLVLLVMAPWYWAVIEQHGSGGPKFLLWEQSFGRLFHQSEYKNFTSPLFFVHTGLWAFLPFTPVLVFEIGRRGRALLQRRGLPHDERRVVWWWLALPFLALSLAEFKLPQYLYWLSPPAALISARAIASACEDGLQRALGMLGKISLGVAGLAAVGAALMLLVFPPASPIGWAAWPSALAGLAVAGAIAARRLPQPTRLAALSVASILGANLFFELHLHPSLTQYQPNREWGELARKEDPAGKALYFVLVSGTNAAGFYAGKNVVEIGPEPLAELVSRGEAKVAITASGQLDALRSYGLEVEPLRELPLYGTSKPGRSFLDPRTREQVVERQVMVRLSPAPRALPASP